MTDPDLVLPAPQSPHDVLLLLERYNGLYKKDASEIEPDALPELVAIEKTLSEVSKEHDAALSLYERISGATKVPVDASLLRKQLMAFGLLSRDLDLPASLQTDLMGNHVENDDKEDQFPSLKPLEPNYLDFEKRYKEYLPSALLALTQPDYFHDAVGNQYAELRVSNKVLERLRQLELLPLTLGTVDAEKLYEQFGEPANKRFDNIDALKTGALVELKGLKLLTFQKQLRQRLLGKRLNGAHITDEELKNNAHVMAAKRAHLLRPKVVAPQTARLAEQLEEQKKREMKNVQYKKKLVVLHARLERINAVVFSHAEARATRTHHFQRAVANFHAQAEKEASRRLERTAKERLQALKANDEEAYMKLLDQTKDTRITHLLKQTNSFLASLASAVKDQQKEAKAQKGIEDDGIDDDDTDKMDYYGIVHKVKEPVTKQASILVGGTLKEYQIKGLEWMVSLYNNHLNGILADEMGLGKTIQSLSLVTYLIEVKKERGPFLIIVPLSTITNWTLECEKWAPSVKKVVYKGTPNQRKLLAHEVRRGDFRILLTTYEYIIKDKALLSKIKWAHMIIDEGHRMKNTQSKLSFTLTHFYHTKNRLILTGTPLQNNLPELWALLNFVLPKIFNSVKTFDEWFNTPFANSGSLEKLELSEEESLLIIRRLHKVLRPFLLRRLKKDVEKDLPDKVEKVIKCDFSALQYSLYQQMLRHNALFVGLSINNGTTKGGIKGLNNKIMQLRKICNHPFVFEEVEDLMNPSRLLNDLLWRVSGKFELLDRVLPKFRATNHRVLIFFQMTLVMDIMEDYLRLRDMKYLRLDGSTKAEERQDMLKAFNRPDLDIFCFLLSTRAGGLGLNLQTADTVIIFDTDWNPHQDLQAQDRAHRIGQKNEVRILRLITNDSVEEVILERAHEKLNIDGKVIQAGKFDNKSTAEEQEAFLRRLLEAEEMKKKGEGDEDDGKLDDDDELNEILARSEDEKILFKKMDEERAKSDAVYSGGRLISKKELPDVFSEENVEKHMNKEEKPADLAMTRQRKTVFYDDGLTEEQWLEAVDDDNLTVEEAIAKKRARLAKRKENKKRKYDDLEDLEEEEEDEPYVSEEEEPKRAKSVGLSADDKERAYKLLQRLKDEKDETYEGAYLCDMFLQLPSKKDYADYYVIIKKPISIEQIEKKLKGKKKGYKNYDAFIADLDLMIENAKTYNEPGSYVYECAVKIDEIIKNSS